VRRERLAADPAASTEGGDDACIDLDCLCQALGAQDALVEYGVSGDELFACIVRRQGVSWCATWPLARRAGGGAVGALPDRHAAPWQRAGGAPPAASGKAGHAALAAIARHAVGTAGREPEGCSACSSCPMRNGRPALCRPARRPAASGRACNWRWRPARAWPCTGCGIPRANRRRHGPRPWCWASPPACHRPAPKRGTWLAVQRQRVPHRRGRHAGCAAHRGAGGGRHPPGLPRAVPQRQPAVLGAAPARRCAHRRVAAGPGAAPAVVVLSACETGLAEQGQGDEMVGLVRAFLVAGRGTRAWPPVAGGRRRHRAVHGRLLSGTGRRCALCPRPAERTGCGDAAHPHPYYWAGFVLQGGW
jgi:hypothetical protein